jgi:integrase/recombinase XerD
MNQSEKELSFKEYLQKGGYSKQAVAGYGYTIGKFLLHYPKADTFTYSDILKYLDELGKVFQSVATKITKLNAVKKYYDYLIDQGKREDHPCKRLYLKGHSRRTVIQNDLFSSLELESLLEREEYFSCLKLKHRIVISLFIFQGLLPGEITGIKLHHIDLDAGTIFVRGGKQLTARKLEIHPRQFRLFDEYLNHDRKKLLKLGPSDYFILNLLGKNDKPDSIVRCIETERQRFLDRNLTAKTIRDSVIFNLLNERRLPLEQVQLFAGHRWICSTQRYLQAHAEEQRERINRWFPLDVND